MGQYIYTIKHKNALMPIPSVASQARVYDLRTNVMQDNQVNTNKDKEECRNRTKHINATNIITTEKKRMERMCQEPEMDELCTNQTELYYKK